MRIFFEIKIILQQSSLVRIVNHIALSVDFLKAEGEKIEIFFIGKKFNSSNNNVLVPIWMKCNFY